MAIVTDFFSVKDSINANKNLQKVSDFLESLLLVESKSDFGAFSKSDFKKNKRVDLDNGIFAILQTYPLKKEKDAFFETHRKYVDFQLTLKGVEGFLLGDSKHFKVKKEYNDERDLIVYKRGLCVHRIFSVAGTLCVFLPSDVHAGGIKFSDLDSGLSKKDSKKVYKVVVKIPIDLIDFKI